MSQMLTNQDISAVNKQSEVQAPKVMNKEYIKFIQQTLQGKVGMASGQRVANQQNTRNLS